MLSVQGPPLQGIVICSDPEEEVSRVPARYSSMTLPLELVTFEIVVDLHVSEVAINIEYPVVRKVGLEY